jgi:hypothetical protein
MILAAGGGTYNHIFHSCTYMDLSILQMDLLPHEISSGSPLALASLHLD